MEQGSPEWHAVRAGIATASNFDKVITAAGKPSKQLSTYINQLVGESLLGRTEEGFKNHWTDRGHEVESEAREYYEFQNDVEVEQVGFITIDDPLCGCSPDGLIGSDGGFEIKCPKLSTHIEYLTKGKLPSKYHRQVQGSLFVTGRKWWDFMSYYPGLNDLTIRVYPDKEFHAHLKFAIENLNKEVKRIIKAIS